MSDANDDYEPAIEPSSNSAESGVESVPVGRQVAAGAAAAAEAEAQGKIGEPPGEDDGAAGPEPGPRAPRVWNAKSRALFRAAVQGAEGKVIGDDLEPMEHKQAPAKAAPAAVASPAPAPAAALPSPPSAAVASPAPPTAAAAAPVAPPPGLPELPDLPLPADTAAVPAATPDPKLAEREQALSAREAALLEREKQLPDRRAMIEAPGKVTIAWLKEVYGLSDETDLKTAVADLITDLSIEGLKIGVPDEHVNGMNSRRATRVVKVYASDVDRRERALKDREAQQAKDAEAAKVKQTAAQQESAYVAQIGERLGPAKEQYPFLHDTDLTGGVEPARVVYEVMLEQRRQAEAWRRDWEKSNPGRTAPPAPKELQPNLATATQFADKYYRSKYEEIEKVASRHRSRTAQAPAPAQPAKPAAAAPATSASPGGAPGPAPTPAAKPEPEHTRDPSDLPDRRAARAATFAKLKARAAQETST